MNIALVFPPFYFEPMYNMPPLGLINLATMLKGSAHNVGIFDFPLAIRRKILEMGESIYRECARQILSFEPQAAGFSVQCTTLPPSLRIAEELKKLSPRTKVIFGGHNVTFTDERILSRFPFVDLIVRGEGELTFLELVKALESGDKLNEIDGITFRSGGSVIRNPDRKLIENLDVLPVSDYSFVAPLEEYRDLCGIRRSIAILEVGRGCPHRCIYCSQSILWRRHARTFSIERLISEMKNLADNFGAECFLLAYDQFTARRDFAEDFCYAVIEAGLNRLPWYCISRLDTVNAPLLKLMREAGCETMCYGIDSGSEKTLAFIRKNIDRNILFERVRETTQQEILPTLSFVIGFPEETAEDLDQTLKLALMSAITGNANILVQMATILPGTDLYKRYSDRLVREADTYFSLGIEFNSGTRFSEDDALIDSDPLIFSSFYNLPCPAGSLKKLNDLASYFSIVASLYPRSLLLLSMESGLPISEIFCDFLDNVAKITGKKERTLTPWDCYTHFEAFAHKKLSRLNSPNRDYMPELLDYETCLIQAGSMETFGSDLAVDIPRVRGVRPSRNEKVPFRQFTFDIPRLIMDLKSGRVPETCPRRGTWLIFTKIRGEIDIQEINDFGADFLQLCDGQRSLDSIAGELYPTYGAGKTRDEFAVLCAEAAGTLSKLHLLMLPCCSDESREEGR